MFAPSVFSGLPIEHKLCSEVARMPMNSFPVRAKYFGNHQNMKGASWKLSTKQKGRIKTNVRAFVSPPDNSSGGSGSFSVSERTERTKQFYDCINNCINRKDVDQLSEFISENCKFEDFSQPIEGKKAVMDFLKELVDSMGENVTFNIGDLCEGGESSITLNWHLEWNKKKIPFAGGNSKYEWARVGNKLVIWKFRIVFAIQKPEDSVLIPVSMLKVLSWLFPQATEFFCSHNEE